MINFWNLTIGLYPYWKPLFYDIWLTCNGIADKGLVVGCRLPPMDILDFGKSSIVTATAKVPLTVCFAMNLITQVSWSYSNKRSMVGTI